MTKSEILKKKHTNVMKCRLLAIMELKGDLKCCTLSPRNASWGHPWAAISVTRHHLQPFSSHWPPKSRQNEPESLQNTLQKVTNSSHLKKVNQSQRRPLIPSNFTESARKQIKPCPQISYKTLPLSRPSTTPAHRARSRFTTPQLETMCHQGRYRLRNKTKQMQT